MTSLNKTIKRIQMGDPEAFGEIIQEFGPTVRAYLYGHIQDHRDIEELSQEIFVALYWNLNSYNPDLSFAGWVRGIARNKLMSYLRRHYSQKNIVNELRAELIEDLPIPSLTTNHPITSVQEQLRTCMEKQSQSAMQLIEARYFERESVIKIAEQLNSTVDAVSSRLYRIRAQLKLCMEGGLSS